MGWWIVGTIFSHQDQLFRPKCFIMEKTYFYYFFLLQIYKTLQASNSSTKLTCYSFRRFLKNARMISMRQVRFVISLFRYWRVKINGLYQIPTLLLPFKACTWPTLVTEQNNLSENDDYDDDDKTTRGRCIVAHIVFCQYSRFNIPMADVPSSISQAKFMDFQN